jgi:hypothetical protein
MNRLPRKELTEEHKARIKKRNQEFLENLSLSYQLGFYVGEHIIDKYLPTLSIDMIQTRNNISVTCAEGDKYRKLSNTWFELSNEPDFEVAKNQAWYEMRAHDEILREKYIPKILRCNINRLYLKKEDDIAEFKRGLIDSLWDCDCCYYSLKVEDISLVLDEDTASTEITLKR